MLSDVTGGDFWEFWTGPLARAEYRKVFVEVGYGFWARRGDDARSDLPAEGGDVQQALGTLPSVAWFGSVGMQLRVSRQVDVVARMTFRVRYYNRRGDTPLADNMVHGTQSYQPFLGFSWVPGR